MGSRGIKCIYIYLCIYVYISMYICIYIYVYMYMSMYICICISMYIYMTLGEFHTDKSRIVLNNDGAVITVVFHSRWFHMDFNTGLFRRPTKSSVSFLLLSCLNDIW